MPTDAHQLKTWLVKKAGLSGSAIDAAWPEWWSDAADASASAQAELRFSIARKLGLDPRSLFEEEGPRFYWDDSAKYKNFTGDAAKEGPILTSFGMSVGRLLCQGKEEFRAIAGLSPAEIRHSILKNEPFVRLENLLGLLWGVGIPVIHLRVYPLSAKRMCAMALEIDGRNVILLAKDSQYPASIIFHLAHEIGHVVLGHVSEGIAIIDMENPEDRQNERDQEELDADRFALELLTGSADPLIEKKGAGGTPRELAAQVAQIGRERQIEPGTLALCYGHVTHEWATVQAAMPLIYQKAIPAWQVTNLVASRQINWQALNDESAAYLHAIMGGVLVG